MEWSLDIRRDSCVIACSLGSDGTFLMQIGIAVAL